MGEGYMPFCSRPTWEERVAIRIRNAEKARRKMQNSRSTLRARKRALEASSSSSSSSGGSSSGLIRRRVMLCSLFALRLLRPRHP